MSNTLSGFATSLAPVSDIVCAYATSPAQIQVEADPVWQTIGEFDVPQDVDVRLTALGFASVSGVKVYLALYNPEYMTDSLITLTDTATVKKVSSIVHLVTGVRYKIAMQVTSSGPRGLTAFRVARTVYLGAP